MIQPVSIVIEHLLQRGRARFFMDTCFLLNKHGLAALDSNLWEFLHSCNCPVVMPYQVACELERHSKSSSNPDLAARAKQVLGVLGKRKDNGHVRLLGTSDEKSTDQIFLEVFTRFRPKYDLFLFTDDKGLCRDLLRLNETEPTLRCSNEIWVAWHTGGDLFAARHINDLTNMPKPPSLSRPTEPKRPEPLFRKYKQPRVLDGELVGGRDKFQTGQTVHTERGETIRLGTALAAGGEGEIFDIDRNQVAKIYYPDRRTAWRKEKLALMCAKDIPLSHVNWPTARLLAPGGGFVGYVMPFAKGTPLQHAVFGKATIQEKFPRWNRLNLVTLARTVAETVQSLNELGVIVGDLNPMNFLVAGDTDIRLVDVDSVQVGDFPCPVGMVNFRAPEITEPSFEKFLRNEHHEAFALATLLFMILMGGKPPFSFQGGGDPAENIRKGKFPYGTDQGLIPAGAYRYIWSFLPYDVKNAFEKAFTGKDPSCRPSAARWVEILGRYCNELQQPKIAESLEIWPTTFMPRDNEDLVKLRCAECFAVFQTSARDAEKRRKHPKILCSTCVTVLVLAKKAGENHTCKKCGKLFRVDFHEVQKHGDVLEWCQECVGREASQPRTCKECGKVFTLELGETRFLLAKGYNMPKRCGPCRGKAPSNQARIQPQCQTYNPPPLAYQPQPHPRREPSLWELCELLFK